MFEEYLKHLKTQWKQIKEFFGIDALREPLPIDTYQNAD